MNQYGKNPTDEMTQSIFPNVLSSFQHFQSNMSQTKFNWIFSSDKFPLSNHELTLRQKAAKFIHHIGTNLNVSDCCINTAIVYMHRFYMVQACEKFLPHRVCAAALFLACKIEDNVQEVQWIYECIFNILCKGEATQEMMDLYMNEIIEYENILLSTLGFQFTVGDPYSSIDKIIKRLEDSIQSLSKPTLHELTKTASSLATQSIFLTSFCVQYSSDLIACFCIQLASIYLKIKIPPVTTNDGLAKPWFYLVNKSFHQKQIQELTDEFETIYEQTPDRYKEKFAELNKQCIASALIDNEKCSVSSGIDQQPSLTPPSLSTSTKPSVLFHKSSSSQHSPYRLEQTPDEHPSFRTDQKPSIPSGPYNNSPASITTACHQPQAPYGHGHHSHSSSLPSVGANVGQKRSYDSSYDITKSDKRTRLPSSSSQQWNNK